MTGALILAVIVTAGEAQSPVTQAIGAAASEAMGGGMSVVFFEAAATGGDAELLRIEETAQPRATARVIWQGPARTQALLRVHVARTDRWIERALAFAAADSPGERGRTVGFAIASMLPEADPILRPAPAPPEPAAVAAVKPPPSSPRRRFAGAAFRAGGDVDGVARGIGGALELGLPASDHIAVRLTAGARGGAIASLSVEGVSASMGAGVAWSPWADSGRSWDLALRADALLIVEAAEHERAPGESAWQATLLPGADALIELGFSLAGNLQAVVAAGAEFAIGTVDVTVVTAAGSRSVRLPVARGVGQLGLRLGF